MRMNKGSDHREKISRKSYPLQTQCEGQPSGCVPPAKVLKTFPHPFPHPLPHPLRPPQKRHS